MANDGFNGSTINFASSSLAPLRSIDLSSTAAKVKLSGSSDVRHTYTGGLPDETISCEIVGTFNTAVNTTNALTVNWFDGQNDNMGNAVLIKNQRKGSIDGEITTSLEFAPAP